MKWLRTLLDRLAEPREAKPVAQEEERTQIADLSPNAFSALAMHPVFRDMWTSGPLHEEMENLRARLMIEKDASEMFQLRAQLRGMQQVREIVERAAQHEKEKPKRRAVWHSPFLPRPLGG